MAQDTTLQDEVYSARDGIAIVSSAGTTYNRCRAVYCGISSDYDITFNGTDWIKFTSMSAGVTYPLQALGARHNGDGSAPSAGGIVFLY